MGIFLQVIFLLLLSQAVQPIAKAAFSEYEDDRKALLAFKAGLSDHSGTLSSWNQRNADFCRWEGVTCHNTSQPPRVSAVTLPSRGLTGTISPVVGNLSFLQSLNLSSNQLGGEIPATIGFLHHLGYLNLGNNSLYGVIPDELCNCSSLVYIRLDSNLITGSIPVNFGAMSKLESIFLYLNNLTGPIPPSFGNLSALRVVLSTKTTLRAPYRRVSRGCATSRLSFSP
uniref:Uncharacterized protein n=1 Tax=Avena sativa TaxID=4498 RepID=A0ACD5W0A5_AVESA